MATVERLPGVIATGKTIEECREDLIEVIRNGSPYGYKKVWTFLPSMASP
jgi:hypothetical protein